MSPYVSLIGKCVPVYQSLINEDEETLLAPYWQASPKQIWTRDLRAAHFLSSYQYSHGIMHQLFGLHNILPHVLIVNYL